jgi:hypothetical protein
MTEANWEFGVEWGRNANLLGATFGGVLLIRLPGFALFHMAHSLFAKLL